MERAIQVQVNKKQKSPYWENRDYTETGYFLDGQPNGEWNYTEQITRLDIQDLKVSQLQYKIQTLVRSQKGAWRKGIRNGEWNYQIIEKGSDNSVVKESLMYNFRNGWLNGPLKYENLELKFSMLGQLSDGIMVGNWFFKWEDSLTEIRFFDKGILLSLKKITTVDTQHWEFPLSPKCKEALSIKEKTGELTHYPMSLTFSDGYHKQSKWIDIQKEGRIHLEHVHDCISVFLPEWKAQVGLSFGTNRCIYPHNTDEEIQLSQWLELSQTWKGMLDRFADSLGLISKYPQQQGLYEYLNQWLFVQYERWNYTKNWREIMESGRLVYYHRQGEIFTFAKELLLTDTIKFGNALNYYKYSDSGSHLISFLVNNTLSRMAAVTQNWLDSLRSTQKRFEFSKFLLKMSIEIQKTHDSLWLTCKRDSLPYGRFYPFLKDFETRFLSGEFEGRYQLFINESNTLTSQELGDSLLKDLKKLEQLQLRCLQLEKMWRLIDTFYSEPRVDAFTFERMTVRNKKRLYEQFEWYTMEEIARHFDGDLNERLSSTMRLRRLFQSYLYLRDVSTSVLERKLNKAKNYADRRKIWESI